MDKFPPLLIPILQGARRKKIGKGQIILYEGDVPGDAMIVKEGIVKIHDIDDQGNEKILHLVKRPAIIPFAFYSGQEVPTRWFYSALTNTELFIIPREQLLAAVRDNSTLALYLMNHFSMEIHEILTRLSSLGKTNTRDKLIAALKFLAVWHSTQKAGGWLRVTFPVNHQLLADMVGITRESAAIAMKEFQTSRVIRNPRMTILEINLPRLGES